MPKIDRGGVRILFYGRLAEAIAPELHVDATSDYSVAELRDRLADAHPEAKQALRDRHARACVGNTLVRDDYVLGYDATVEFLPPVSGG